MLQRANARIAELQSELAVAEQLLGRRMRPQQPSHQGDVAVDEALLRQIQRLCRPDKWHGKPEEKTANEVQKWINKQRKR